MAWTGPLPFGTTILKAYEITSPVDFGIVKDIYDYLDDNEIEWPFLTAENHLALDWYYNFTWSGDKLASPVLRRLLYDPGGRDIVAQLFVTTYGEQLLKLWNDFAKEYDPVEDYHVIETTKYEHAGSGASHDGGSDGISGGRKTNYKPGMKVTENVATYDSLTLNKPERETIYAPTNNVGDETGVTYNDTKTYGKTRTTAENSSDDLVVEKKGNLGVIPFSKFLKDDIELWQWNFYNNVLFKFIDKFATLPIY